MLRRRGAAFVAALGARRRFSRSRDDLFTAWRLRIGTTGDYPPFTKRDSASGDYQGFDIDLAHSLGGALGVRVEFVATSWATLAAISPTVIRRRDGRISVTLERAKMGFFSAPYLREGKTPIARCADKDRFATLAASTGPESRCSSIPAAATSDSTARISMPRSIVEPDNTTIFDALAERRGAIVMITDASETRYQQKLHPGVLCAIHPDAPFDFGEKAYWARLRSRARRLSRSVAAS